MIDKHTTLKGGMVGEVGVKVVYEACQGVIVASLSCEAFLVVLES